MNNKVCAKIHQFYLVSEQYFFCGFIKAKIIYLKSLNTMWESGENTNNDYISLEIEK